jgi:hypothetical protein
LQKCAEQKAKLLAELKKNENANEVLENCMGDTKRADMKSADNAKEEHEQSEDDMLLAAYES